MILPPEVQKSIKLPDSMSEESSEQGIRITFPDKLKWAKYLLPLADIGLDTLMEKISKRGELRNPRDTGAKVLSELPEVVLSVKNDLPSNTLQSQDDQIDEQFLLVKNKKNIFPRFQEESVLSRLTDQKKESVPIWELHLPHTLARTLGLLSAERARELEERDQLFPKRTII